MKRVGHLINRLALGLGYLGLFSAIAGVSVVLFKESNQVEIVHINKTPDSAPSIVPDSTPSVVNTEVALAKDAQKVGVTIKLPEDKDVDSFFSAVSGEGFMKVFYPGARGQLANVLAPCDPGCYVDLDIGGQVFTSTTNGIGWKQLYDLEDEVDPSIMVGYSSKSGFYVTHLSTNTVFGLNGAMEVSPIDVALKNCYSTSAAQTTHGMEACIWGAELAWNLELNRAYEQLGGSSNEPLKSAQTAWISYKDAQFESFNSFFGSKNGTKWRGVIALRRVQVVRQQVELLQSYNKGY